MTAIKLIQTPVVIPLAEMRFLDGALTALFSYINETHPDCFPPTNEHGKNTDNVDSYCALFPHNGLELNRAGGLTRVITDNELLTELSGRLCYYSFGAKVGTPTNKAYIDNTQQGTIPHRSITYHPKMSFFISGISRRVTHELMRNYVGADRTEEGSPSQESTRYVEHPGWFIVPPWIGDQPEEVSYLKYTLQRSYDDYLAYIQRQFVLFAVEHEGRDPKGLNRKRIYESASAYLSHTAMTSLIWTTNPAALNKLFTERLDQSADLEFQRFARIWKDMCVARWPNLFPV